MDRVKLEKKMAAVQKRRKEAMQAALERPETGGLIRGKWIMDGARSLAEAAVKLEETARYLRELAAQDYELEGPIEDDMGLLKDARRKRTEKESRS